MTERIFIDGIRMTGDALETQMREAVDYVTVQRYAEAMERGDSFPMIDLVEAGDGTYYIADGWHRLLAHLRFGRTLVEAVVYPGGEGEEPRNVAIRMALKANTAHGLHLKPGDQRKKARAALLHPEYQGWSLRALEGEVGIGKSTIGRVRNELIIEGLLVHPATGERMPDSHASTHGLYGPFRGDWEAAEEVYRYVRQLTAAFAPKDWEWDEGDAELHRRLCETKMAAGGFKRAQTVERWKNIEQISPIH